MKTPTGWVGIRFVPANEFGVSRPHCEMPDGQSFLNPMRVVPNGEGCEIMFTLFQLPEMDDEQFGRDAEMVMARPGNREKLSWSQRTDRAAMLRYERPIGVSGCHEMQIIHLSNFTPFATSSSEIWLLSPPSIRCSWPQISCSRRRAMSGLLLSKNQLCQLKLMFGCCSRIRFSLSSSSSFCSSVILVLTSFSNHWSFGFLLKSSQRRPR